ncbi:MAG: PilC/PilY family type IV pilus protein, partial [Natronospirillum sp.]
SDNWGDVFSGVTRGYISNRYYDVSYNPSNFDPDFSGTPWDSSNKAYRVENPSNPGHYIHYNVAVPGYSSSNQTIYCSTRDPASGYLTESFRFRCYEEKLSEHDGIPNNNSDQYGYTNYLSNADGNLADSARARGVTHWGKRMVSLGFGVQEYISAASPGLGFLHVPIARLEGEHKAWLETKVGPQDHSNPSWGIDRLTDSSRSIVAAGLTPLEGSMYTARDYLMGQSGFFGTGQGSNNALASGLPETCSAEDAALIWLTDGMPSVSREGTALGANVETAVAEAVAAVEEFHSETQAKAYMMGFSLPPSVPDDALDRMALAGGTTHAFMAEDEDSLREAMQGIFSRIVEDARLNASTVATTSSRLDTDTATFQAIFESGDWTGDIESYGLSNSTLRWSANEALAALVNPMNHRVIYTAYEDSAVELKYLDANARDGLNYKPNGVLDGLANERIHWLYGQQPFHSELRGRTTADDSLRLLSDIVNSNPLFVGHPNYGYRLLEGLEGDSYGDFRAKADYRNRPGMVYVGANDGMLHAFDAATGEERFAFMPSELLFSAEHQPARITSLMAPEFSHQYFVDGSPEVGDAYIDGWRTVLVGTMGAGGRTVFALDISDPENFSASDVLWEFTYEDDEDLGYGVTSPQITRLPSGEWAAIFGNGYGGASGEAVLYVVNLATGALLHKLEPGEGSADNPNAMAAPFITDWPHYNRQASSAYAGDLLGNMWRIEFDKLNDPTINLLFNTGGKPITSRAVGQAHPYRDAFVVSFGTGSYFLTDDAGTLDVQSLYGLIDSGNTTVSDDDLGVQTIIYQGAAPAGSGDMLSNSLRVTSKELVTNDKHGWQLDLIFNGKAEGERVINRPSLAPGVGRNAVRFTTLIPDEDPCGIGRTGYLMELNLLSGARSEAPVFDLDGDGHFDEDDQITITVEGEDGPVTVVVSGIGGVTRGEELSTVQDEEGTEQVVQPVAAGEDPPEASGLLGDSSISGRVSWEQLR